MLTGDPSDGTLCLLLPLFMFIRLRHLEASDHVLYQLISIPPTKSYRFKPEVPGLAM